MITALLAACLRQSLGAGSIPDVAAASRGFDDWSGFLKTAERHDLLPLIAGCFEACSVQPPEEVQLTLDRAHRQNAKRVLVMTEELKRICRLLAAGRIPVLAIKGPVIAHSLYHDPAQRVFCDLDLLTPKRCLPDARRILSDCGYEPSGSTRIGVDRFTELGLENAANGIHVDLHWELTPPDWYVSVPEGIWERKRTISIGGQEIETLGEEDTFLHLCLHGAKHGWSSLNWLVDLCSLIMRSPGIAERSLALLDPQPNCVVMVRFGVAAAANLLPGIRAEASTHLCTLAQQTVGGALLGTMREETVFRRLRFQWNLRGNRVAMCRFVLRRLLTPNQDDWNTLPLRRLSFLLVPWRLLRLSWELISEAVKQAG